MVVLALLVARGYVPGERAYVAFQSARDLSGLTASPLYLALLTGAGRLGLSIPQVGMILSVAGWLASIVAVYWISLHLHRPVIAIFAAAALTLEPLLYQMLGQDALFVMGWLWGAAANIKSQCFNVYRVLKNGLLTSQLASLNWNVLFFPNPLHCCRYR